MGMTPFQYRDALAAIYEAERRQGGSTPPDPELDALIKELAQRLEAAQAAMQLETKSTATLIRVTEVKTVGPDTIDAYAATFGNVDLVRDRIEAGAFTDTLLAAKQFATAHGATALYPLLWQHDAKQPIGAVIAAREDGTGLRVTCKLDTSTTQGRQALNGLTAGYLALSIGYQTTRHTWAGKVRQLQRIDLAEISVVTFPSNPEARAIVA